MTSPYTLKMAAALTADQLRVLRAVPDRGSLKVQSGCGDGKLRYELKRAGLISMTRPDGSGNIYVYRTVLGNAIVTARAAKARTRVPVTPPGTSEANVVAV